MGVVLVRLGEPDGAEPLPVEGRMIAAPPEPIGAEDEFDVEISDLVAGEKLNRPGKLAAVVMRQQFTRSVARPGWQFFAKDSDMMRIRLALQVLARSDNVAAQNRVDLPVLVFRTLGKGGRTEETLFFAGERDKDHGLIPLLLGNDSGDLEGH